MEDDARIMAINRAGIIRDYLLERADRLDVLCYLCEVKPARQSQTRHAYDSPWDENSRTLRFCSDDCGDSYLYEEPWAYFWCEPCDREICEQNPANGWMVQYRRVDHQQICLSCYQDRLLEEGLEFEREKLEKGEIPGMFFSYDNLEAREAGYREVPGFMDYLVNSQGKADRLIRKALKLIDQGKKAVIGYERLAIGGSEGYVTLMVKD